MGREMHSGLSPFLLTRPARAIRFGSALIRAATTEPGRAEFDDPCHQTVGLHHGDAKRVYVAARYGEVFGTQYGGEKLA
jgi:hypothetical protein